MSVYQPRFQLLFCFGFFFFFYEKCLNYRISFTADLSERMTTYLTGNTHLRLFPTLQVFPILLICLDQQMKLPHDP